MAKKRKTRQEKKITELRRLLALQKTSREKPQSEKITTREYQRKVSRKEEKLIDEKASNLPTFSQKEIKSDLYKTAILATLAISFELMIYILKGHS